MQLETSYLRLRMPVTIGSLRPLESLLAGWLDKGQTRLPGDGCPGRRTHPTLIRPCRKGTAIKVTRQWNSSPPMPTPGEGGSDVLLLDLTELPSGVRMI